MLNAFREGSDDRLIRTILLLRDRWKSLLSPPIFKDEEKTREGQIIYHITVALMVGLLVPIATHLVVDETSTTVPAIAAELLCVFIAFLLNRRGAQNAALRLLAFSLLGLATFFISMYRIS